MRCHASNVQLIDRAGQLQPAIRMTLPLFSLRSALGHGTHSAAGGGASRPHAAGAVQLPAVRLTPQEQLQAGLAQSRSAQSGHNRPLALQLAPHKAPGKQHLRLGPAQAQWPQQQQQQRSPPSQQLPHQTQVQRCLVWTSALKPQSTAQVSCTCALQLVSGSSIAP